MNLKINLKISIKLKLNTPFFTKVLNTISYKILTI
jgi:hypothetical protein